MNLDKLKAWIQQPTTLVGLSMAIGSASGVWFGVVPEAAAGAIVTAALPLLVPDNSTKRTELQVASMAILHDLATKQPADALPVIEKIAAEEALPTITALTETAK